MIYMDAAATAKYRNVDDIIVDTITTAMKDSWQNPSSLYAANVKDKINKCRTNIAKFIGAKPDEIYFTSGSSESNNWAIRGWVEHASVNGLQCINVISTNIEHKSILELLNRNILLCANVDYCDVDKNGLVNLDYLKYLLLSCGKDEPIIVSIHMANNEIGSIQPIREVSDLVHEYGGVLHVDATQSVGHIPIDVEKLGIDMMSCSGHKISPVLKGIGFLYKKNDINIYPLIYGEQENKMRGGTENTFGIIGLSKAIEYCDVSMNKTAKLCNKRDCFIDLLCSVFDCKLNGHSEYRLPNNINVTFPQNITGEALMYMLDMSGIKVNVGSACNSNSIKPSHVLKAIGLTDDEAIRSVRFTLSDDVTYEDIDYVIDEIRKCIKIIETN